MNSGTVHLIATDPPFNKGRDFHATPDSLADGASFQDRWSWDEDVHPDWVDQITDDWPAVMEVINGSRASYGDDMGAFLCFMGVRLLEMRRVLREDGSIYLHCDPTASHYLKELMDAIFGRKNFQNEFVWYYSGGGASKRRWARKHDLMFFYTKGKKWTFNYDDVRTDHKWDKGQKRADGSERDSKDKLADDVFEHHSIMPWARERMGYPTQKPLALYKRIIKASSNEGDRVLDPFAGCATTCVAAEQLKRQWVGIDIWDKAHEVVIDRLRQEGLAAPDSGADERLLTFGDIHYERDAPVRTDEGEEAVPSLKLRRQRPVEPWTRLSRMVMTNVLAAAQGKGEGVVCAGCGRALEREFMQLDHKMPRKDGGDNHILNRILLCGPCNRKKGANLTLNGLQNQNKRDGWLVDKPRAEESQTRAQAEAERIAGLPASELEELRQAFA